MKKKFIVIVSKEWVEPGEVTVEADDEEEAREKAQELLSIDDDSILWHGSNMDPGATHIDCVKERK